MNLLRRAVSTLSTLLCGCLLASVAFAQSSERTNPAPLETPSPQYPEALAGSGKSGTAVIEFTVDADGRVQDPSVASADDPAFGEAALAVLPDWRFEPGRLNGVPEPARVKLPFRFAAPAASAPGPEALTPEQQLNAVFKRELFMALPEEPVPAKEVGRVRPLKPIRPAYPKALRGSGVEENVRVRYVVTPEGKTVNPVVVGETRPEFRMAAIATVARTEYRPLKKNGKPVYVMMTTRLKFTEKPPRPRGGGGGGGGDFGGGGGFGGGGDGGGDD